jgi:ribosomal protein S18 acetylase RimI-like enzyme
MMLQMAASARLAACRIEELRSIPASRMRALLEEETRNWRSRLHWDFTGSEELITRYINMRALDGLALVSGPEIAGYCYWVTEEHKAILGDLYVRDLWRSPELESQLLNHAIETLRHSASLPALAVHRVESQLMQIGDPDALEWRPENAPGRFPRIFMLAPLERLSRYRAIAFDDEVRIFHWGPVWFDATANLIAQVYRGHVDSLINDQYKSARGAERFLRNIVNFPGCGSFQHDASFVALAPSGDVLGCVIATRVAPETGHIAQLCASEAWLGRGLGYELLRRSMLALRSEGCHEVSLTVTESNRQAQRLYARMGFHSIHRFQALVWEH